MKTTPDRANRRKRGVVTAWIAAGMIPLVGLMGLALDFGHVAVKQSQLQSYVDAKSVAYLKEKFGTFGASKKVVINDFVDAPGVAEAQLPNDVGIWNFNTRAYSVGAPLVPQQGMAPAVPATLAGFDVPLFFGPLFGIDKVTLEARSVAYAARREVVIVQDVSGSMVDSYPGFANRMEAAKSAVTQMITLMGAQDMPFDRVGLVTFDFNANPVADVRGGMNPVFLASSQAALTGKVAGWSHGGGTNVPSGLQAGIAMFSGPPSPEVERLLIVVGDGVDSSLSQSQQLVTDAWNQKRIHTYSILIGDTGVDYLNKLPRGRGTFRQSTGNDLAPLLASIVTSVPMRLVE
jgi:hypothetical protein